MQLRERRLLDDPPCLPHFTTPVILPRMSKPNAAGTKDFLVVKGIVEENLPSASFRVKLENGHDILCHLAGKLRKNRIRLTPGDEVQIEISPYDLTKGRIIYRF